MAKHSAKMGLVQHLSIKPERKASMSAATRLMLRQGHGIEQDVNANSSSPRQILVVNAQDLADLSIKPGELRENLVISKASSTRLIPGAKVSFPSGAIIRLTFYCEPCSRVAYLVDSLKNIEQKRGVLGVIVQGGAIAVNDTVKIEPNFFPALSEIPYERFLCLIAKIPYGKVITYRQILQSIGVDRSYFRVMPTYIKKTHPSYPIHRILDSQGKMLSYLPLQSEKLAAEGVKLATLSTSSSHLDALAKKEYSWQNSTLC